MSRGRTTLAIVAVTAVAVIAGCTQKTTPAAVTATPATPATSAQTVTSGPSVASTASTPRAASVTSAPPAQASPAATRYTNARFGFSFDVPAGYRAQPPPVDGDGLSFASPARTATVTAYGASNVARYSPAQEMAQLVKTYQSARATISYRFSQNDVIALSGTTPQGTVFYQREVVYPAVIYTLLWNYPAATKAQYDRLVTQTVDSFAPGPDHTG